MFSSKTNDFIFTSYTTPAVSTNLKQSVDMVLPLVGVAYAVNVTDSLTTNTRLSRLLDAADLSESRLYVIFHLPGHDSNR